MFVCVYVCAVTAVWVCHTTQLVYTVEMGVACSSQLG